MSMNWINFQNTYKKNKKNNLSFDGTLILKDRKKSFSHALEYI